MPPQKSSLAASAIAGVRWNYVGSVFSVVCSLTIGAILARILGPGPFGQAIIATTIYSFVNLFVNGGFSQALIQKVDLPAIEIRRTFTFQMILGAVLTGAVALLAPIIAVQFHDPSAAPVIRVMSLIMLFQAFGLVSAALLRRTMRFKAVQWAGMAGYLFGYAGVGVPMAYHGFGVWSLVWAYLSQAIITSALLYGSARHSLVPSFHLPDRSIWTFGGTVIATNVVNWGHFNLDNLASSRLGPTSLGLYGRACNLAYQPVGAVVTSVQSVLLSASAKVQQKPDLLKNLVLAMLGIIFGLLGPAYATLAFVPDTVIVGLYGTKWLQSIPIMVPLALAMPFYGGMGMLGPVLTGLGKPKLEFWPQAITCAVAAIAFFTASHYSILAIGWALLGISMLRLATMASFTFHELHISWKTAFALIGKRVLMSVAFGAIVYLLDHLLRLSRIGTGLRLACVALLAVAMLAALIWRMAHVVFGRYAVHFLLGYAPHLPSRYVKQLRIHANLPLSAAADQTGFN